MPQLARLRSSLLIVVVAGVLAGIAWASLASPAALTVRPGGQIVLTEKHAAAQFSVVMLFLAIGALVSLAWGVYCAVRFASWGAWMIGAAIVGAAIASVLCWLVGVQLGPSDPRALTHLTGGETVHDALRVDSVASFVVWPWCAVLAAGLVTLVRKPARDGSNDNGDDSAVNPHGADASV